MKRNENNNRVKGSVAMLLLLAVRKTHQNQADFGRIHISNLELTAVKLPSQNYWAKFSEI